MHTKKSLEKRFVESITLQHNSNKVWPICKEEGLAKTFLPLEVGADLESLKDIALSFFFLNDGLGLLLF